VTNGEAIVCAQAIKPIHTGQEITADYGEDFFDEQKLDCECKCCQKNLFYEENIPEGMHTNSLSFLNFIYDKYI